MWGVVFHCLRTFFFSVECPFWHKSVCVQSSFLCDKRVSRGVFIVAEECPCRGRGVFHSGRGVSMSRQRGVHSGRGVSKQLSAVTGVLEERSMQERSVSRDRGVSRGVTTVIEEGI